MKTKYFIIGGIIVLLWLAKRKSDAKKEEKKLESALKSNEMPMTEQIDIIRLKIEDFLALNFPFMNEEERMYWVVDITSNLENFKAKFVTP